MFALRHLNKLHPGTISFPTRLLPSLTSETALVCLVLLLHKLLGLRGFLRVAGDEVGAIWGGAVIVLRAYRAWTRVRENKVGERGRYLFLSLFFPGFCDHLFCPSSLSLRRTASHVPLRFFHGDLAARVFEKIPIYRG